MYKILFFLILIFLNKYNILSIPFPNLNPEIFSIGIFSRVEEQKGQHLVLDAMNMSSNQMQLCIIGHVMSKQYKEDLLINAKIYHLTNYLKFVNFVDSPMSYMPFFDLLILPTYEETFGLVAAEAMIMGVPVIGSNAGGVPEIISHGSNGLLFETKNARSRESLKLLTYGFHLL